MDIYTQNGDIIRQFPRDDGTSTIELEFILDNLFWSRLFSVTIFYISFRKKCILNYVFANHTLTRIQMLQKDFDINAKKILIQTLMEVKNNANLLLAVANRYLFNQPNSPIVRTNEIKELEKYEVNKLTCLEFLEQFYVQLKVWL